MPFLWVRTGPIARGLDPSWLEGHLFDHQRIVPCCGAPSTTRWTATRIASQLMTLDATGDDAVQLQLDCPGGTLESGFDGRRRHRLPRCARARRRASARVEGCADGGLVAAVYKTGVSPWSTRFRLTDPDARLSKPGSPRVASQVEYHRVSVLDRYHERLAPWRPGKKPLDVVTAACEAGRYLQMPLRPSSSVSSTRSPGRTPPSALSATPGATRPAREGPGRTDL